MTTHAITTEEWAEYLGPDGSLSKITQGPDKFRRWAVGLGCHPMMVEHLLGTILLIDIKAKLAKQCQ